jgi:hypothetical protein
MLFDNGDDAEKFAPLFIAPPRDLTRSHAWGFLAPQPINLVQQSLFQSFSNLFILLPMRFRHATA